MAGQTKEDYMNILTTLYSPLPIDINKSVGYAYLLMDMVVNHIASSYGTNKTGGYQYIQGRDGSCLLLRKVGYIPTEADEKKYKGFALEKGQRLRSHPEHTLSFQPMDVAQKKYQGAVRMENGWIHSFSGFSPNNDEAIAMAVGVRMGWSSLEYACKVMHISQNEKSFWKMHKLSKLVTQDK